MMKFLKNIHHYKELLNNRKTAFNRLQILKKYKDCRNINARIRTAKEEFWFSGGIIDSEIVRANNLVKAGYDIAIPRDFSLQVIQQQISDIALLHNDYGNLAREAITTMESSIGNDITPMNKFLKRSLSYKMRLMV